MGTDSSSRVFWTYWTAGTVSSVGSAVTTIALPLTALVVLHATAFEVGLLTAASFVAWLVIGLPAGALITRLPLRRTQVAMDLVRAAALASVPAAWWLDVLTLAQLVLVALVVSFANVLFEVGNMTFLPSLVGKDELAARNSMMSATHATVELGGPAVGGVLVQVLGAAPTLLVDTVSYLVSAVLMRRLPERTVPAPATRTSMREMIRDGWRFVVRHPVMGPCLWEATATNFACGALMALAPVYLVRELGAPAGLVGVLIASEGIGTLLGAALVTRFNRRLGTARVILVSGFGAAMMTLLLPAGHGVPGMVCFAVGNAGFATGVVIGSVNTRTYRQTASPPELLSRVMATTRFVSWGAVPVGALLGGLVASGLGVRTALWCMAASSFVPTLILLTSAVARVRDLEDVDVPAELIPVAG